ncbi:uncharacterized protein [Euphorbia lathyris]|uniref:uncharacterized protein n=1 Tax=Euphorbia lathyris TaxID=212925 RepID=UPI003313E3D6
MALNNPPTETLTTAVENSRGPEESEPVTGEEDDEEEVGEQELEKLEMEAEEMAKKILEYRATLPDQLKTTLTSILSSQRPSLPDIDSGSDPGPARESTSDSGEQGKSSQPALPTVRDQKNAEKLRLLKERISSNISAMPIVTNRVKECMSKIENLDSYSGSIHPAFKKKKTS